MPRAVLHLHHFAFERVAHLVAAEAPLLRHRALMSTTQRSVARQVRVGMSIESVVIGLRATFDLAVVEVARLLSICVLALGVLARNERLHFQLLLDMIVPGYLLHLSLGIGTMVHLRSISLAAWHLDYVSLVSCNVLNIVIVQPLHALLLAVVYTAVQMGCVVHVSRHHGRDVEHLLTLQHRWPSEVLIHSRVLEANVARSDWRIIFLMRAPEPRERRRRGIILIEVRLLLGPNVARAVMVEALRVKVGPRLDLVHDHVALVVRLLDEAGDRAGASRLLTAGTLKALTPILKQPRVDCGYTLHAQLSIVVDEERIGGLRRHRLPS